jgi:hypothetical protein
MPKERPRSRLVVLADILGITIKPCHVSRGGQVTRSFFLEVASAIGVSGGVVSVSDKISLCRAICRHIGVDFDQVRMTSRGARITNAWFEAVMARFDSLRAIGLDEGAVFSVSEMGRSSLAAHRRLEREPPTDLDLSLEAACYSCGDVPGGRLQSPVLEAHCTLPYSASHGRLPASKDFVAVCPSCHKVLHLRGIQAKIFRAELRP